VGPKLPDSTYENDYLLNETSFRHPPATSTTNSSSTAGSHDCISLQYEIAAYYTAAIRITHSASTFNRFSHLKWNSIRFAGKLSLPGQGAAARSAPLDLPLSPS